LQQLPIGRNGLPYGGNKLPGRKKGQATCYHEKARFFSTNLVCVVLVFFEEGELIYPIIITG
jgi:hypothetical protein